MVSSNQGVEWEAVIINIYPVPITPPPQLSWKQGMGISEAKLKMY